MTAASRVWPAQLSHQHATGYVARNVNWEGGGSPPLPSLSSPLPFSPPLPLLTGVRGITPGNFFLKLKVLVGEFQSILGLKVNTFMNQVF